MFLKIFLKCQGFFFYHGLSTSWMLLLLHDNDQSKWGETAKLETI